MIDLAGQQTMNVSWFIFVFFWKLHALTHHLAPQMLRFGGIGCLTEDFMEQGHQTGKVEEKCSKGIANPQKKAEAESTWKNKVLDPSIQAQLKEVNKKKRPVPASRNLQESEDREMKRRSVLNEATTEANPIEDWKEKDRMENIPVADNNDK